MDFQAKMKIHENIFINGLYVKALPLYNEPSCKSKYIYLGGENYGR